MTIHWTSQTRKKDAEIWAKSKEHKLLQLLPLHSACTDDHAPAKWKAYLQLAIQPHTAGDVKQQPFKAQIHAKHHFTLRVLATLKTRTTKSWIGGEVISLKKLQVPTRPSSRGGDNPGPPTHQALCLPPLSFFTLLSSEQWVFIPV